MCVREREKERRERERVRGERMATLWAARDRLAVVPFQPLSPGRKGRVDIMAVLVSGPSPLLSTIYICRTAEGGGGRGRGRG